MVESEEKNAFDLCILTLSQSRSLFCTKQFNFGLTNSIYFMQLDNPYL